MIKFFSPLFNKYFPPFLLKVCTKIIYQCYALFDCILFRSVLELQSVDYFTLKGHGKVMVIVVHFNSLQNKQRNNENFIGLFVFKICVDQ